MVRTLAFIVILLSAFFLSVYAGGVPGRDVSVVMAGNSLEVHYAGTVRLSGGRVLIEHHHIADTVLTRGPSRFSFPTPAGPIHVDAITSARWPVATLFLSANGYPLTGNDFLGVFFTSIPGFDKGLTIWRYKPWNSWSKPIRLSSIAQMEDSDVQFFYWKYADGLYGAALPLSGKGYRTTLGQADGAFGAKSVSYCTGTKADSIPQMAIGFGGNPYRLFEQLYEEGLTLTGRGENLRAHKTFPPILENIGWCTWNASDMGKNLNEKFLLNAAASFARGDFPLGWLLVDDGWFDHTNSKLNSFRPDTSKFPQGFAPVIRTLKETYGIKDVGIWHALDGYWQGINPESPLGQKYLKDMTSWEEKVRPDLDSSETRRCSFISPYAPVLDSFYLDFHRSLKREGFSFIKVDNQLITERMSVGNFPLMDGAAKYHAALNGSAARIFDTTIINCMDMTPDAYLNFGRTAVARAVEDYFPYEQRETYNLQRGNAAAHVLQAVYNSLYFSQMVFPDFDMFESYNPNAVFHAIARAINNGPVYITDNVGQQRFDVLRPLVYSDGRLIRSATSLLPCEECLFQVQDPRPFKASSKAGDAGLLGVWNCADADSVNGFIKPSDVRGLTGEHFGVYEHFSGKVQFAGRDEQLPLTLGRMGYKLYYVLPLVEGNGVIGLVEKYNAPATVLTSKVTAMDILATVYEGGKFAALCSHSPRMVTVDGRQIPFRYDGKVVLVSIPPGKKSGGRHIHIALGT